MWIHARRRGVDLGAMGKQCRCSECRRSFEPSATVGDRARVCGPACRRRRRRRQKKRRREADLEGYRADECERQRRCRARRRESAGRSGPAPGAAPGAVTEERDGCHGPSVSCNPSISERKALEMLAEVFRVSRTGFERELSRMQRKFRRMLSSIEVRAGP